MQKNELNMMTLRSEREGKREIVREINRKIGRLIEDN